MTNTPTPVTDPAAIDAAFRADDESYPPQRVCFVGAEPGELPDEIRVPLHRLWADAGYLIGRAKLSDDTDLAVHTIKALCDEVERAVRAAIASAPRVPQGSSHELSAEQIKYPRDLFDALISGNSPYAFYLFQWVPYQTDARRWRLKMLHDVRTFDGREAFGIWPNGKSCGPFRDDEVEFIRISSKQLGDEWKDPRPQRTGAATPPAPHTGEQS